MPGVVTAGRLVDDRYRLLEILEEGGMGILWRAEDLTSERYVIVKELRFPDPLDHMQRRALAARVRREARAMAAVSHPGLAHIVDVVDDGDRPWVVTEEIDAPTLAQLVAAAGPMDPERVALLGIKLLDVLEAAGDQDMVHRFLQPSKVYVSEEGDVRLADFGIASLIGDPSVASTGAVGSVTFMAPEQAGTAEADIWSLGAVLYFAVEGAPPFDGEDSTAILAAVAADRPRPTTNAGPLARALELALEKDPSERPSAEELRSLLEVAAGPLAPRPEPEADHLDLGGIVWPGTKPDADLLPLEPVNGVAAERAPFAVGTQGTGERSETTAEADGDVDVDASSSTGTGAPEPGPKEEVEAELPPPEPLPPRVALERMFSPAPGSAPFVLTPEDEHREPPPPWPVVHKRGLWTTALVALVTVVMLLILVTNGRTIFSSRTKAAQTIAAVKWAQYVDPSTGFKIDYPADWAVTHDGIYTDFKHPQSAAALRVVVQDSTASSALAGWVDLEKRFIVEQPSYSRVRMQQKQFRGLDAAEWEFKYTKTGVDLHNIDLGVVTGSKSYALNFETRDTNWNAVEPLFQRFESSFRPPTT
ncbi:MAG TPA: protein kinase [Acidimicrobiales bacterium]|nr:protein kinase [Acidimicrobiales bacterium]